MSKQFLKVVKLLHRLDAQEVAKVITLASMCLNEHLTDLTAGLENQSDESVESRLNRALTSSRDEPDDCDHGDCDPNEPTPTKKQLDLRLLIHRMQDPRLSAEEKKEAAEELSKLIQEDE